MLILKENAANSVPTPPAGKDTFFIDDSGAPSVKNSSGTVTTFPTTAASNAQVLFMNGSSITGDADMTWDYNTNILTVIGNVSATRVLTDNLLYANGAAWDLQQPGGSNSQIQFNDNDQFGGSAAFTFDKTANTLTLSGNLSAGNVNGGNLVTANYVGGTLTTASQPNVTSVGTLQGLTLVANALVTTSGVDSAISGANLVSASFLTGTLTTAAQPNITSVGALSTLSVTGNANVGNIGGNNAVFTTLSGTLATAAQPNITSLGTLSGLGVNGTITGVSITANTGVFTGNGSGLSAIAGGNVSGQVANALVAGTVYTAAQPNITSVGTLTALGVNATVTAVGFTANTGVFGGNGSGLTDLVGANVTGQVANALVAGTVYTNAQPNITSVGTLSSLAVTGNTSSGNFNTAGKVVASSFESNVATGTAPFVVASTTKVTNLNADLLDGYSTDTGANTNTIVLRDANGSFSANVVTATLDGAATTAGTVTTAAQPNITSVGTLSSVAVTGNGVFGNVYANSGTIGALTLKGEGGNISNVTAGNITGQVANALVAGTVYTAAQPNITSVGTLTGLGVNGNITAANITANTGVFTGNGSGLSAIAGGNVTGQVANALVAGTVYTAAQPNITSVGTLTSLGVNGTVTAVAFTANTGVFTGNGSGLSAIAGANVTGQVANALVAGTVYTAAQPNITSVGTLSSLAVTGNATAGNVYANSGTVGASLLAGTLTTAAQPNITSVGTLSSLSVTGNVAAGNLTTVGVLSVTGTGTSSIAGNLDMTSNNIINLAEPVNASDAATKGYVDSVAEGLHTHDSCNAATNTTLASISGGTVTYNNGTAGVGANLVTTGTYTTIDGVTLSDGMRILVKNEANAAHNGIYVRSSSTVLTRATDFDTPAEMAGGDFTFITAGTLYDNTGWVMTDAVTTVGTSPVNWTQFSGSGTYTAGTGLTLTGTQFSVNTAQPTITSVGTLTSLGVSGTITAANITANTGVFTGNGSGLTALAGANVTGQVANALVAGTVYTAAQPNITSVGTLTSLGVNGTVTAVAFTANTGVFTGNGSGLSAIAGANVTGQVGNALVAGTVYTAAQPNITSVGTLSSLAVTGNVTAANFTGNHYGNGSTLESLNASNISSGTLAQARLANASVTLGSTALTLGSTVTTVAGLTSVTSTTFVGALTGAATTAGTVTTAAQPNITSVGTLSSLAVSGNITGGNLSVSTGTVTLGTLTTGANTTAGTVTGNWTLSAGSRWNATYADLAEKYVADATYEPGTVLVFGGDNEVTLSDERDSHRVAGVVSTNPAYTMNNDCPGEHVAMIALQGRVPCKVVGPVSKGDLMVSSFNGFATANNHARAGTIIGKALSDYHGSDEINGISGYGVVEIAVGRF